MANELANTRVAFVVANEGIEQAELLRPWQAVADAGGDPQVVAPHSGMVETMCHLDRADRFPVDQVTDRAQAEDFDAVVLPGAWPTPTACGPTPRRSTSSWRCSRRASRWPPSATGRGR